MKNSGEEETLIRTETMLEGPCLFIKLEKETSWPCLLRNDSDYPITFSQVVSTIRMALQGKVANSRCYIGSRAGSLSAISAQEVFAPGAD